MPGLKGVPGSWEVSGLGTEGRRRTPNMHVVRSDFMSGNACRNILVTSFCDILSSNLCNNPCTSANLMHALYGPSFGPSCNCCFNLLICSQRFPLFKELLKGINQEAGTEIIVQLNNPKITKDSILYRLPHLRYLQQ